MYKSNFLSLLILVEIPTWTFTAEKVVYHYSVNLLNVRILELPLKLRLELSGKALGQDKGLNDLLESSPDVVQHRPDCPPSPELPGRPRSGLNRREAVNVPELQTRPRTVEE